MDNAIYLQTFAALSFVIGMILLLGWAGRKFGLAGLEKPPKDAAKRRLGIVESMRLDATRKLVLLRCDNAAHLVIIGGPQDLVIDTHVKPDILAIQPESPSTESV